MYEDGDTIPEGKQIGDVKEIKDNVKELAILFLLYMKAVKKPYRKQYGKNNIGKTTDGFGVRNRFIYLASSGDTSVSGADANGATLTFTDGAYVDVYLNGVLLKPTTDYNTSTANTIAGLSALNTNDEVTVVVYDVFTVADMVSATSGGTFSGNVKLNGGIL